jgi:hypothetical protein
MYGECHTSEDLWQLIIGGRWWHVSMQNFPESSLLLTIAIFIFANIPTSSASYVSTFLCLPTRFCSRPPKVQMYFINNKTERYINRLFNLCAILILLVCMIRLQVILKTKVFTMHLSSEEIWIFYLRFFVCLLGFVLVLKFKIAAMLISLC